MRHTLALVLALAASACSWPARGEVWDEVHGATLSLGVPGGSCSGTAVGRYVALTAAHCFLNAERVAVKPASVTFNGQKCEVSGMVDDGHDHVLLTVIGCEFHAVAKVKHHAPRTGEVVFLWGSPAWLDRQLRVGRVAGYGPLPGAEREYSAFTGTFQYFDIASYYGDSGSGVFNMQGELVAVLSVGTDPLTAPFHLTGTLPLSFTDAQWTEATL